MMDGPSDNASILVYLLDHRDAISVPRASIETVADILAALAKQGGNKLNGSSDTGKWRLWSSARGCDGGGSSGGVKWWSAQDIAGFARGE
jgi:hypothetical protein